MSVYRIRLAKTEDVPVLIALNKDGLRPYRWAYNKDFIRRAVSHGNYYVICHNGEIIGAIKLYLEKSWLWIGTMVVFKLHRGKGHAKRLMRFARRKALKYGYNKIRLDTLTISRAGKFYEKMGYKLIEEGPYYGRRYRIYEKEIK